MNWTDILLGAIALCLFGIYRMLNNIAANLFKLGQKYLDGTDEGYEHSA